MSALLIVTSGLVFLLSLLLTRYLCSPTSRLYLLDYPNERSLHTRLTPRTGGLAIIVSLLVGLAGLFVGQKMFCGGCEVAGVLFPGLGLWLLSQVLVVVIVSFCEDIIGLPIAVRFGAHILAAVGIVLGAGQVIQAIPLPGVTTVPLGWLAIPASVLFIVWMTNLYNFMDGMDGFAGGMTAIGFGFLAFLAWAGGHYVIFVFSVLLVAAAGGFLYFNLPPARVFMGDVGSTGIGFLAGALAVIGVHDKLFDLWVPVLVFSPFGVDATATLLRRLARGQRVWRPHREHYYQRLVLAGWGHRKTVRSEYVLMLAAGTTALIYNRVGSQARLVILIAWGCAYLLMVWGVQRIVGHSRRLSDDDPGAPEIDPDNSMQVQNGAKSIL
jgi:UDP-N-acetylmuramyl pentapeptide phosphotransferase/UDP-N-acetylglucosamine-1-phosphate transferase